MATKRTEYRKIVSNKGVAVFPHLITPDDKWDKPAYKVSVRQLPEDAADVIAAVDELIEGMKAGKTEFLREEEAVRLTKAIKAKKLTVSKDLPYAEETDKDSGELTGFTLLKFKANPEFKDSKTGEIIKRKIKFIDAAKEPFRPESLWGGSVLRVRAALMPWVNAKNECGVKLGIDLVQVIELVEGGGGKVDTGGFDEEDGYSAPRGADEPTQAPARDGGEF